VRHEVTQELSSMGHKMQHVDWYHTKT